jgi:hypothetical protein
MVTGIRTQSKPLNQASTDDLLIAERSCLLLMATHESGRRPLGKLAGSDCFHEYSRDNSLFGLTNRLCRG